MPTPPRKAPGLPIKLGDTEAEITPRDLIATLETRTPAVRALLTAHEETPAEEEERLKGNSS